MAPEHLVGVHPVREALRCRRRALHRLRVRRGVSRPEIAEICALAKAAALPIEEVASLRMNGGGREELVVLEAGSLPQLSLEELLALAPERIVLLDGVEDPQNLGAIGRVAEAAGVGGLVLSRRRAPPLSPAASRASAGALEHLPVARVVNLRRAIDQVRSSGFWVVGADSTSGCNLYELPDRLLQGKLLVVLGGEGHGLRRSMIECLDHRIQIPMAGRVESLNVSAAAAVLLFDLVRRARLPL